MMPVGKIRPDYIRWFDKTDPQYILQNTESIVFIEDGVFGIRQMTNPWDEFKALKKLDQRDVITKFIEIMEE